MNTRAHAWMPASPCGAGCLPADAGRVNFVTAAGRWMLVVAVLTTAPFLTAGRSRPAPGASPPSGRSPTCCCGVPGCG